MLKKLIEDAVKQVVAEMLGAETPAPEQPPSLQAGDKVILRSRDAGVWYGKLVSLDVGKCAATLSDARQMWRWYAASGITLIDVADKGVDASKCKFSPSKAHATMLSVCAVIAVSDAAYASLESVNA